MSEQLKNSYRAKLKEIVAEAEKTDYIMPVWLPFIGAIILLVAMIPLAGAAFAGGKLGESLAAGSVAIVIAGVVVGAIMELYVIYKWIARRNDHFGRVQRLYETVISYLNTAGSTDPEIAQMRSIAEDARFHEQKKSAGLWMILYIVTQLIPLVGFIVWAYIMHFLTKDFAEHEHREQLFFKNLSDILRRKGIALEPPARKIPKRNTILYIILVLITFGLFNLYWVYVITKDPNEHFKEHRRFEQELVEALARI